MKGFDYSLIKVDGTCYIYAINIKKIGKKLGKEIDKSLVSICIPNSSLFDLKTVKNMILSFLKNKTDKDGIANKIVTGYICEFFCHLFLKSQGFNQEFSFFNLEENSLKKGHDGVYTKDNEDWIMESKSSGQINATHKSNIKKACKDLSEKISGDAKNNAWLNAFHHVKSANPNNKSLAKRIEALAVDYANDKFGDIEDFNIIPSSTLILLDRWKKINLDEIQIEIKSIRNKIKGRKSLVLCINKKSLVHFKNYLLT